MAENIMGQIVAALRQDGASHYPGHGELRNVRVVGHTPKSDHYIYDIVIDFADGSERVAAKVYRGSKTGPGTARAMAELEADNLRTVHEIFTRKKLAGIPRPIGDFAEIGAVVAEKLPGVPLQSIIMKAALLPSYSDLGMLRESARATGEWLRRFHKATADMPAPFDGAGLMGDLEKLCADCRTSGLDEGSVRTILSGTKSILSRTKKALPCSVVLNDFTPLNVMVGENGIGFSEFAKMTRRGNSFDEVATFMASVEALEKYPFWNRAITGELQEQFLEADGSSQ